MDLKQLLNPCGDHHGYHTSSSLLQAPSLVAPIASPRRQKVPKDAPIFSEGNKPVGIVNFPPHVAGHDQDLLARHRDFSVYPLGEIQKKGVRHIPYNSDKKDFLDKTGRDAFEGMSSSVY